MFAQRSYTFGALPVHLLRQVPNVPEPFCYRRVRSAQSGVNVRRRDGQVCFEITPRDAALGRAYQGQVPKRIRSSLVFFGPALVFFGPAGPEKSAFLRPRLGFFRPRPGFLRPRPGFFRPSRNKIGAEEIQGRGRRNPGWGRRNLEAGRRSPSSPPGPSPHNFH